MTTRPRPAVSADDLGPLQSGQAAVQCGYFRRHIEYPDQLIPRKTVEKRG